MRSGAGRGHFPQGTWGCCTPLQERREAEAAVSWTRGPLVLNDPSTEEARRGGGRPGWFRLLGMQRSQSGVIMNEAIVESGICPWSFHRG